MYVSIHASAREATLKSVTLSLGYTGFNPRLREGGDLRGADLQRADLRFNPRLREGGDLMQSEDLKNRFMFQSTPPRGRRPANLPASNPAYCFNPRLREGGDIRKVVPVYNRRSFNPRLREGGDQRR